MRPSGIEIYRQVRQRNKAILLGSAENSLQGIYYPKIGIYAGGGASHSWLWFVDLFDRMGFFDVWILEEREIQQEALDTLDVLIMSGGDTFAVAAALGLPGALKMRRFIENGGLYMGSCAGAYLPMNSSKTPLNGFNFVDVTVTNLAKHLPTVKAFEQKFCTAYGCSFIFHPVRGNVRLRTRKNGLSPNGSRVDAPLYGGPGMNTPDANDILARYDGYTQETVFMVDRHIADQTLHNKAAVVRRKMGDGCLYLFGPHLEHPHVPQANKIVADCIYQDCAPVHVKRPDTSAEQTLRPAETLDFMRKIKRELSNARIVAVSLEMTSVTWRIGNKVYEPGKIREFIQSMWKRLNYFEKNEIAIIAADDARVMVSTLEKITARVRQIKAGVNANNDTTADAAWLFGALNRVSRIFMNMYFGTQSKRIRG